MYIASVDSGYQVHVPITLSGKKYVLNKQVSKYVLMALVYFHWLRICDNMLALCAFSIARPLNCQTMFRRVLTIITCMVHPGSCMAMKCHIRPGSDVVL